MSHTNSILNLLEIKDENITLEENFYSEKKIKGVTNKFIHANLCYKPNICSHCGHVFDENIIKYGFTKPSKIVIPNVSGFYARLILKKQRYLCQYCGKTFTPPTSIVEENCYISKSTKLSIAVNARDKISEKDIARNHNVSVSTVSRIIDNSYEKYKPKLYSLPKHLCFDEFKSVKEAAGAMSFMYCNSETGEIVDIVENRQFYSLMQYFIRFSKTARHSVKTIVIDIYMPYMKLIKALFPNAKIILDKFHVVQLFSRSLNKTRVRIMNLDKINYTKYKNYWKLLLKDVSKIDYATYRYHRCFKKQMREIDIINYLLDQNEELKASYELYKTVRRLIKDRNIKLLKSHLNLIDVNVSDYMKTSVRTIKKHFEHVENTLKYTYTNGVIEGLNNKIKVIKRISFGYKSFSHFRNRIFITQKLTKIKTAA